MPAPLDVFAAPLDAISLIEASAGTGKTYAITALYLRLLLERGYRISDILVVTYTRAATEELKERLHRRLLEARTVLQREQAEEPLHQALLERCHDRPQALRRLNNALLGFDEAAVFTIHGFCQRVLRDSAFASRMPFDTDLLADDGELLQEIVEDFWRRHFYTAAPRWAQHAIDNRLTPNTLRHLIRPHLNKPYLQIAELAAIEDLTQAEQAFETAFAQTRACWQAQADVIQDLLLNNPGLNAKVYNRSMPAWFTALDDYLNQDEPGTRLPEKFVNFTTAKLQKSLKNNQTAPQHEFFATCDVLHAIAERLQGGFNRQLQRLRYELLLYCNSELPKRKRRRQVQSYDDLLLNLYTALADERSGPALAERLRQRYPAALIDEFQDTDPTQYTIFQTVYQGHGQPVFLVGDPKQAIYSFRGADIFAYLRARQHSEADFTLVVNWRSDPGLIAAVNTLFSGRSIPFLLPEIPFQAVQAAAKNRPQLLTGDGATAPLQCWFVGRQEDGKVRNKNEIEPLIARAVAGCIAQLLQQAQRGAATLIEGGKPRPLSGGDIAVLVRNRDQAQLVRTALLDVGVPSVQHSRTSVFQTAEALELERVLRAVATPRQEALVRAALLTDLLGFSGDALYRLLQDERAWEATLIEFGEYHLLWREQGFMTLFRTLLGRRDGYRRLLAFRDGERRLTNVLHLAELLQEAALQQRLGPAGLLKWLVEQREPKPDSEEDEVRQLRLESDAELVKIVTIHKSKGLEYSVVFCPFLWDGHAGGKGDILSYHDPADEYRAVLDLGSDRQDECRPHAVREQLAEDLRLTYVALTRAKYRCYLIWGAIKDAENSALAWLLYEPPVIGPGVDPIEVQRKFVRGLNDTALLAGLERLAVAAGGAIQCSPLLAETLTPYRAGRAEPAEFAARSFTGRVHRGPLFTSFSALQERRSAELPDYDEAAPVADEMPVAERTIFTFPRGARAGRCLHAILETIDFTQPAGWAQPVQDALRRYGFEPEWDEVITAAIGNVVATPLDADPAIQLSRVGRDRRLIELDFLYPFDRLDAAHWDRLLRTHWPERADRLAGLDFRLLEGFMRGFIDLLFQAGERFWVVDYKSNWLGPGPADYSPDHLETAMRSHNYHLQYLIYTLAVHRYLRARLPGYDYERCFGGIRYLFLRGMNPAQGLNHGVYADRPPGRLIAALDRYAGSGLDF